MASCHSRLLDGRLELLVSEIDDDIEADDQEVYDIYSEDIGDISVHYFGTDARYIAGYDEHCESKAHTFCGTGSIVFRYIQRP